MPDPAWPPEALAEPPVLVDPPDVVDPPAPEPPRPPTAPPPPTGAPPLPLGGPPPAPVERPPFPAVDPPLPRADELPLEPPAPPLELAVAPPDAAPAPARPPVPVERPPFPAVDPPLPRADELPLEPPSPPLELAVAPPDAAPAPARPPVPIAPDEPPRWPPVPLLSEVGEAQLQGSTAIARATRHPAPDRLGLGARGLLWPGGVFSKPAPYASRNREQCERNAFMKTPWDVQGSYSVRARHVSSQFVTAASFRPTDAKTSPDASFGLRSVKGVPVGAARRRGWTPRPARANRSRRPPRVGSAGDRDQSNRGAEIPIPD